LTTFKRGQFRVQVMADDRIAGASATSDATFTIVGTATSLLRDAPPLAPPFRREAALTPPIVRALADALQTVAASAALRRGLESLRASRFVDLVRADSVNANEQAARELLRAIGLLALGDTATAVSAPLRQAQQLNAAPAAVHLVDGAVRAVEGRERDALTAWRAAMKAGFDVAALTPLILDSHLRLSEAPQALELATRAVAARPGDPVLRRGLAVAQMASKQEAEAIAGLEALVADQPEDQDARWLLMHALFAGHVSGQGAGATTQGKQRLRELAQAYVAGKGRHAPLAAEWAEAVR
jgi:predicted Zn-dependent protease